MKTVVDDVQQRKVKSYDSNITNMDPVALKIVSFKMQGAPYFLNDFLKNYEKKRMFNFSDPTMEILSLSTFDFFFFF